MAKHAHIILRQNSKNESGLKLEREMYAENNGALSQDISLWNQDAPMSATQWSFRIPGSYDPALKVLDIHWKHLNREFTEITEQAAYYHAAKTGNREYALSGTDFIYNTLMELSDHLINQVMPDEEVLAGEVKREHYPVITLSQRMDTVRQTAKESGLPLDHFEKAILSLSKTMYKALDAYEKAAMGGDDEDGKELQLASGHDNDEDEDWRQSVEDDHAWRGNEPPLNDGCDDAGIDHSCEDERNANADDIEPWQDEDYDPDDERDEHIDDLIEDLGNYVVDFTNEANKIWMDSVVRIQKGKNVTADPYQLQYMKEIMAQTEKAYDSFKKATQDLAIGAYEMQPVYELLEDEKTGILARMQKIISMASRPAQLEETIKRALPKERGI